MHARANAQSRRSSGLAALALTCVALAAMLVLAASAEAGVRDYRIGVVSGISPSPGDLAAMQRNRARSARVNFSWDFIEVRRRIGPSCATAIYDFSSYDAVVSNAGQRGISIMPTLIDSPRYAAANGARYPAPGTAGFQDFQCFVRAVVGRYGRGGTFPARNITDWQVWNETNLELYSPNRQISPAKYGQLVKATSASIRSKDRRATIILAGLPEEVKDGMNSNVFLRRLYRVNGIRSKFSAVALHPYAVGAPGVKGALTRLRETLRRVGDRGRPVWITEVGWATGGSPKGYFLITSEKSQADRLSSTFRMLRRNRDRFKIGTVQWFRHRDTASYAEQRKFWFEFAGLYRKNGTAKPSCARFRRVTGAAGGCQRIAATTSSTSASSPGLRSLLDAEQRTQAQLVPSLPE